MEEIKFDKRNYRKHDNLNKNLIKKSLKECGAGRSIVIDNDGEIIAGNGIYQQAQKLGIKTKIIETDGSELVVVKRTDLSTEDEKRKQLAIMDNSTSDSSEFDFELLKEDFSISNIQDFGIFDINVIEESKEINNNSAPTVEEMIETMPNELQEFADTYQPEMDRIIITFNKDLKNDLEMTLGFEINKLTYNFDNGEFI